MKIDAITGLAVAFAAFAAYVVLKPKNTNSAKATGGSDAVYSMLSTQRNYIGDQLWQNLDYMGGGQGLTPNSFRNLADMGGGQGLRPSSGFWAV